MTDGKVVFLVSRWNFFEINHQHNFSWDELLAKSKEIEASDDVRFRESKESETLVRRFEAMDLKEAEKALQGAKDVLLPKPAEKQLLVLKAKSGTVGAVMFERLGSVALIHVRVLALAGDDKPAPERVEIKSTDAPCSIDLAEKDIAQLEYTPTTTTTEAGLKPADGAVIALVGSAK